MFRQLSFSICVFSGILLFLAGYIAGMSQSIVNGHSTVTEILDTKR